MYAIVKTGGKQYRVEQGQSLLVERLPAGEGDSVNLDPLLYVDDSQVLDQVDGLSSVLVEARVVGHERGPKLRVVKFKPKRGYKRRTGHRQELTRIEIVGIKLSRGRGGGRRAKAEDPAAEEAPAQAKASKAPAGADESPAQPKPARGAKAAEGAEAGAAAEEAAAQPKPARGAKTARATKAPKEEANGS